MDWGDGGLVFDLRIQDLGDKYAIRYVTMRKTEPHNLIYRLIVEFWIFRNMLRKMREIETKSGFAKQRRGEEGVALLCWKEAISRVSNAAPASPLTPFSISDGSGRDGAQRRRKTPFQSMEVHPKPDMESHVVCQARGYLHSKITILFYHIALFSTRLFSS